MLRRDFLRSGIGVLLAGAGPVLRGQGAPQRIVSTAPSSTEALFALGLGKSVVGVSQFCEFPPEVKTLPKVGSYVKPDAELIVRLRPDLVVLQRSTGPLVGRLDALGIRHVELPYGNLADVFTGIELLGRAAGVPDRGRRLDEEIRGRLDGIRARSAGKPRPSAVLIVDRRPGLLADMVSAGPGSYVGEMMAIAGADNMLAQPGLPMYPRISFETVLRADPEVIVDLTDAHDEGAAAERARDGDRELWMGHRELRAVRENRVYVARSTVLLVPGPRSPEAAELLWGYFHGAAPAGTAAR